MLPAGRKDSSAVTIRERMTVINRMPGLTIKSPRCSTFTATVLSDPFLCMQVQLNFADVNYFKMFEILKNTSDQTVTTFLYTYTHANTSQ